MKYVLVLLLCVTLFFCTFLPAFASYADDYPDSVPIHFPESGDVIELGYDNATAFEKAVKSMDVPTDLIMPEDLKAIGNFVAIIEQTDWQHDGQFWLYMYILDPHNEDGEFCLEVNHTKYYYPKERPVLDLSYVSNNMTCLDLSKLDATLANETSFSIYRDGLEFVSVQGKLSFINWAIEDTKFTITRSYNYQSEKTDYAEGSFMNALLSLDEEKFAYARDILLSLGEESDKNPSTGDPAAAAIALCFTGMALACLGLTATITLKKRKNI